MDKYYLSSDVLGVNTKIICDDATYLVPTNIINQIAELTDTDEEAMDLYAYVKTRMEGYNQSLELTNRTDVPRGDLSPIMIKDLLVALLSSSTYEKVIMMLDEVCDYELFSTISLLERGTTNDAIQYLVSIITGTYKPDAYVDEDDAFNNRNDRCSEIQSRKDSEEQFDELTEDIGIDEDGLYESGFDEDEMSDEEVSYNEKVEALTAMNLKTADNEEAHRLGLNPICQ